MNKNNNVEINRIKPDMQCKNCGEDLKFSDNLCGTWIDKDFNIDMICPKCKTSFNKKMTISAQPYYNPTWLAGTINELNGATTKTVTGVKEVDVPKDEGKITDQEAQEAKLMEAQMKAMKKGWKHIKLKKPNIYQG